MAKQIIIKDKSRKNEYTLEFTRATVEAMERRGFNREDLTAKPVTMIPEFFYWAFSAHHKRVSRNVVEDIYAGMPNKTELLNKLLEMYNECVETLFEEPEETEAGDEGNLNWTAAW